MHKDITVRIYRQTINYEDVIDAILGGEPKKSLIDLITFPSTQCIVYSSWINVVTLFGDDPDPSTSTFKNFGAAIGFTFPNYNDEMERESIIGTGYKSHQGTNRKTDKKFGVYGTDTLRMFFDTIAPDPDLDQLTQGELNLYISYGDLSY